MECLHEYDFGTPTTLSIRVVGKHVGPPGMQGPIEILARNSVPEDLFMECAEAPAVMICDDEDDCGDYWLCAECARKCGYPEELSIPIVNSPRMGVCGYAGGPLT
jgi:hypothetical protein